MGTDVVLHIIEWDLSCMVVENLLQIVVTELSPLKCDNFNEI